MKMILNLPCISFRLKITANLIEIKELKTLLQI